MKNDYILPVAGNTSNAKTTNPFEKLLPLYEKAWQESLKLSEEEADRDWIQNKPSKNGSQSAPVTYVLPVSGRLVRI